MTDIKSEIAHEALNIVNGARRSAYGKPEQNFGRIADFWMTYFKSKGWQIAECSPRGLRSVRLEPLDIAAMMRLMKEARLAETPDHRDSYVDLVGYALCGAEAAGVAPKPGAGDTLSWIAAELDAAHVDTAEDTRGDDLVAEVNT